MRRALLVITVVTLALGATAMTAATSGQGVVTGRVYRDATKIQCVRAPCLEPAPGVRVTFRRLGVSRGVTTGPDGSFRLALPAGLYRVTAPGLVRTGVVNLDAVRVRAGARVVLALRVSKRSQ